MTEPPSSRFAVNLDYDTDATYKRITDRIGEQTGRLQSYRGQRHPSRADVLRAMLTVVAANPQVERAVLEQVRADALRYPSFGAEVRAVADDVERLVPHLNLAESRDWLTEHVIPGLRDLGAAADSGERPIETAAFLASQAQSIARHGATAGGYEYLRPMLALAERVQRVRDALDPREKVVCPRCAQLVRTVGEPGGPTPKVEHHIAQAGEMCPGTH